jgi:transposase-like protein
MVLEAVACKHCGQTQHVKRYGTTRAGTQRYRCFDCGRTFVQTYTHKARDPLVKEQITQMVLNGAGIRDTAASAVRSCFRRQSQYRQLSV